MKLFVITLFALASLVATGCDEKKDDDASSKAEAVEEKIDKAVAELSEEARFDKEYRKKACKVLTPELVAETFDVPKDELKQMKIMGCRYTWTSDDEELRASLSLRALKSEKSAATWFDNSTADVTQAEMREQMEEVKKRVKERKEVDTEMKKKTSDKLGDTVVEMTPDGGYTFKDIDGLGEEARQNEQDGTVTFRVDNLIATVQAYKGKSYAMDFKPGTDLKKMAELAKKAGKEAQKKQAPGARKNSLELARAVVSEID